MTQQKDDNWLSIFKSNSIHQVIYFVFFVVFIIGSFLRVEAMMSNNYAGKNEVAAVKQELAQHEAQNTEQFVEISGQLKEMRGYVIEIARNTRGR